MTMRRIIPEIAPVVVMLDAAEPGADLRFSGVDLKDGARVVVSIERAPPTSPDQRPDRQSARPLLLVLNIETFDPLG